MIPRLLAHGLAEFLAQPLISLKIRARCAIIGDMSDGTLGVRVGLLGGSFNPIHWGHLILAQDAREHFDLSRVIFMPCARSPHKQENPDLAPAEDRLAMAQRATEGLPWAEVSDLEVRRGGISYTVETVETLRERHPDWILFLILGSDSLRDLPRWYEVERLLTLCRLAILSRPGFDVEPLMASLPLSLRDRVQGAVRKGHLIEISSTEIRQRVAENRPIDLLMPREAAFYLHHKGLYRKQKGQA